MAKRPPKVFARPVGPLSEAIPGHWNALASFESWREHVFRRKFEKLRLLAEAYGIANEPPEFMWPLLALALADEHEPGFRIQEEFPSKQKRGRRPDITSKFEIYIAIERMRHSTKQADRELTVWDACKKLHQRTNSNRQGSTLKRTNPESIETAYYAAKAKFGDLSLDALERVDALMKSAPTPKKRLPK